MNMDISQLQMPPVSPDGLAALKILQDDEPDIPLLSRTVLQDSILSLTLIKYANSPLYRRTTRIDNVPAAIRVLGTRNIRSAIIMATMRPLVRSQDPVARLIWQHCSDISFLCERLTRLSPHPELADEMTFLGLTHDIGMLVLAYNFPDIYEAIIDVSARELVDVSNLEQSHLGIRHDDIVEHILRDFRLPECHIALLSAYHSDFCTLDGDTQSVRRAILDAAHYIWQDSHQARSFHEQTGTSYPDTLTFLKITEDDIAQIKKESAQPQ